MRKLVIFAGVLGALATPMSAQAARTDDQNAAQECRFERGATAPTREAFALKYATNANRTNAFGKCVSRTAREERHQRAR